MPLLEINKATRNGRTLFDFVCYCICHPDERFWQALRNWSGYDKILVNTEDGVDTFYWEGARHDHKRPGY
jgi:hypothetical protein